MKFIELASYLERLEKTSSRLEITGILAELFKKSEASEIDKIVYLSLGILAPNYESVILNLAERMMINVLAQAYDEDPQKIKSLFKNSGDLGNVAQELAKGGGSGISVSEVYDALISVAKDSGAGSAERKVSGMAKLLERLDPTSVRFVARIPVGRLRLGFSEKTVMDALRLASLDQGNDLAEKEIEDAYNIRPDIGYIARLVKTGNIKKAAPELGVPVVPMLAQRLNSTSEMIKKMGEVSVEPKFDGLRIFIHFRKPDFIRIFTRNMNSIDAGTFPELDSIGKYIKAKEIILDTEAVGIDEKREMFLDFQKTITRRRKHDVAKSASEIPLQFQVFDMLLIDGRNLINEPYVKRRELLEKAVVNGGLFRVDENTITKDPEIIKNLHQKYLKMGLEGVVVKRANGFYVSGRTGWNWVKMKEEEGKTGKLADTIDCVVMGYTRGRGKRAGFGVGQFLAGIRDGDIIKTITKVGTGLTDEQFKELNLRLKKLSTLKKPKEYEVHKDLTPDFWVTPDLIVELAADEITKSPKHSAGLALRFPRLIRFRDDKNISGVTTKKEVNEFFRMQKTQ
jgi:DNA ligase-1